MTTIIQADRVAAASVAVLTEMRELILAGRADYHAEPFARHRAAGFAAGAVEGAKAMQAKAAWIANGFPRTVPTIDLEDLGRNPPGVRIAAAIAALDPAQIAGGKP